MSAILKLSCAAAIVGMGLALGGCNTLTENHAKSCDGYDRRPLNRSLWDWEGGTPAQVSAPVAPAPAASPRRAGVARPAADGTPVAETAPLPPARPGAPHRLAFDAAGARKPCA